MTTKKIFTKCVSASLIMALTFSLNTVVFAFDDDDWSDWDAGAMPLLPEPEHVVPPSFGDFGEPHQDVPAFTAPVPSHAPVAVPVPPPPPPSADPLPDPSLGSFFEEDLHLFTGAPRVDAASEGFIRVIRHPREGISEVQNAVIEGLQVTTETGTEPDEIIVTCYFIFRDRPTSYFFDIDRKNKKLSFEFVDAQIGSAPIAALEQAPLKEIVIEAMQVDANKSIKGLQPEWHDAIRITFDMEHLPVIAVSAEHNIISFTYKWTTDPEKIPLYVEKDRFPMVFWLSGGALGAIGLGVLSYFLFGGGDDNGKPVNNVLSTGDLPSRPRR